MSTRFEVAVIGSTPIDCPWQMSCPCFINCCCYYHGENPLYEKFRQKGLRFARELTFIFRDVLAIGETLSVPSATQTQIEDDDEDVYHPTIDL
ncbi:uncharacterized protein LOC129296381 isoform X2 [Prosopis cineraria]|uniref:uncharacterized protein LOC129296381 isoform X2 n=1 Tax=Prosopis cineraria TaxID=364024 RepID=UPI002410AB2C|nr:uncharacterized protein LOC129296381 isoform X2 [Prosopis cineraria]